MSVERDEEVREEGVDVPWEQLPPPTLRRLVEEFVTREGTDYGFAASLEDKVEEVLRQLRQGDARVSFDLRSETATIVTRRR